MIYDKHVSKEVKIQAEGAGKLPLVDLHTFQGDLKFLPDENYEKLKNEILTLGFSEPVSVWKNKNKTFIINGHQRVATLIKMQSDGYKVPKIPVSFIMASTLKEAKMKVLALTSQYGIMTNDGLTNFAKTAEIDLKEIGSRFVFPEIDMSALEASAFEGMPSEAYGKEHVEFDAKNIKTIECPQCGNKIPV